MSTRFGIAFRFAGSLEIGVAATKGDAFEGMTLAEDLLILEPVDQSYRPVPDSAVADRLLVTKLVGVGSVVLEPTWARAHAEHTYTNQLKTPEFARRD